uniref:Uncharacterized protein AlNc14C376G11173 n=1 Tax=Albugo laibachii Nc14 TaxID=890382 RepID=F0WYB4_9STRA|nr:conserved hypothetical protein [Albugo laibachii Nc14]|eukprot:CCA26466.1 conserved hypothetical protein [Albugo laibachii Nc14]
MPSASTHRTRYRNSHKAYIPQKPWQLANKCAVCNGNFSPFRLRHHCRNCGISVCGSHSRRRVRIPSSLSADKQRVCDACFQVIQVENMSSVGDSSLLRANLAKRADYGRQVAKTTARETGQSKVSTSSEVHRGQRVAGIPIPSQTIREGTVGKHPVRAVLAPKKNQGMQPDQRHRRRESKRDQRPSKPKQRTKQSEASANVSRDRSGVNTEEGVFAQHEEELKKQCLVDAKVAREAKEKRRSRQRRTRAQDGNVSDDADAIALRLLASKRSIMIKSQTEVSAKPENDASSTIERNEEEMEVLVDTIARKEQLILQNQMEVYYFYHKRQLLQRREDDAARVARDAADRIQRIKRARAKVSNLVCSAEKLLTDEEYQAAIIELLRAIAIEHSNAKAWRLLAQCRMKIADYAAAEIACRTCIQFQHSPTNLVLLGQIMICKGRADQAIEYYQKALTV